MSEKPHPTFILVPAYGRDYTTILSVTKAWNEGKDFLALAHDGSTAYCSKRDFAGKRVFVRFDKRTRLIILEG